jgi:chromosome segregation ATPase
MALEGKAAHRSGWHRQAERLAAVHTVRRAEPLAVASNAPRQQPLRQPPRAQRNPSNELGSKLANYAELKRQDLPGAGSNRTLDAQIRAFVPEAVAATAALAAELGLLRDEIAQRENENSSLQTSLNLVVLENAHLSSLRAETDAALAQVQSQLDLVSASLTRVQAERDKLAAVVEARERQRAETNALNARCEAASSRALAAETLLAEVRQSLTARTEENNSILSENSRLSGSLAKSDIAIDTVWSQVETVRALLTAADADRDKVAAELEAANEKYLTETNALAIRLETMSTRAAAAEKQLAAARRNLAARAEENSLIVGENSRLFERLAESDAAVDSAWSQLAEAKTELTSVRAERDKLAAQLNEANEKQQAEVDALSVRLEAMATRAEASEKLLAQTRQNLILRAEESASILGKNSWLSDCVVKKDKEVDEARSRIEQLSAALMTAESERDKLTSELHDARERRRAETDLFSGRLEEMFKLAVAAERAFTETRQSLVDKSEELRNSVRSKAVQIGELEHARSRLIEGASSLLNAFKIREAALTRAEEGNKLLTERIQILLRLLFAQSFSSSCQLTPELLEGLKMTPTHRATLGLVQIDDAASMVCDYARRKG